MYHLDDIEWLIRCFMIYQNTHPTNSHQRFILKTWLHRILTEFTMLEANSLADRRCNRSRNKRLRERMNVLEKCRTDSVMHFLYQAMLYHNAGEYKHALRLIQRLKEKISAPGSVYFFNEMEMTTEWFRKVGGENLTIDMLKRRYLIDDIWIHHDQCIPELYIETNSRTVQSKPMRFGAPTLVCAFFLEYLCHRKLGHVREANKALDELSRLVHNDNGRYICKLLRSVSLQILGICQQTNGDVRAACQSYLRALKLDLWNVKVAASVRLGTILAMYFWQYMEI